jgi:hypothetical protein
MNELTVEQQEIVDAQGWNENTVLCLALRFIHEKQLNAEFEQKLQEIADEENNQE